MTNAAQESRLWTHTHTSLSTITHTHFEMIQCLSKYFIRGLTSCVSLKKWIDFDIWPVKHFLQIFLFLLLNFALRVLYSRLIWILGNSQTFKELWLSWKPWKKQPLTVKPSVCVCIYQGRCVCVCLHTYTKCGVSYIRGTLTPFLCAPNMEKEKSKPNTK